jgi:predicted metal-dependent phosphoesterase TrpH
VTEPAAVDLHVHTTASDGSDSPAALVELAGRVGLRMVAITDHDTVEGVAPARLAGARLGVEVVAGCEVTAELDGRVVHLLCYGEGLLGSGAIDRVVTRRRQREERNRAIGERLRALTGVGYEQAASLAGPSALSRAHFALALIEQGTVRDVAEAFDRFLSAGRPAYVPAPSLPAEEVLQLVHGLGGVVVLAHPGRLPLTEQDRVVAAAVAAGVDGVEVWHSQHDPAARRRFCAVADRHGLLRCGGSDYHGSHKPAVRLGSGTAGNAAVPWWVAAELRGRLAQRAADVR